MSKYDLALDMESDNSLALILRNVRPRTEVLEVACAHGRMTKYLREQLQCRVTILEKDADAARSAEPFASDAKLIGEEWGDLERNAWSDYLRRERKSFDCIVFADILEHLSDPEEILGRSTEFLREGGSLWVSVPNIGHNSIVIELLDDRFEYRDLGLLDRTHIHFFSESSLLNLVRGAGLRVVRRLDPLQRVTHTEFKNSYERLPQPVADFLRARRNGEVYQFVWELKK
jgi:2-polyprenyl-3-methyl-5-hydroxy-6-metoxy-1,4-benzoquinol methylase